MPMALRQRTFSILLVGRLKGKSEKKKKINSHRRHGRLSIVPIGKSSAGITLFFEKILSAQSEVCSLQMREKNDWASKAENCTRFARILLLWILEIRFDVHQRFHEKPLSLVVTLQTESAFHPIIVDKSNPMTSWRGTFSFQHSGETVNAD